MTDAIMPSGTVLNPNTNQIIDPLNIFQYPNQNVMVFQSQYILIKKKLNFLAIVWTSIAVFLCVLSLSTVFSANILFLQISSTLLLIGIFLILVKQKKYFSSGNLQALCWLYFNFAVVINFNISITLYLYICLPFLILNPVIILYFNTNGLQIFMKCILQVQVLFIFLKIDQKIQLAWTSVFLPIFATIIITLVVSLISLLAFLFIIIRDKNRVSYRTCGFFFIFSNSFSIGVTLLFFVLGLNSNFIVSAGIYYFIGGVVCLINPIVLLLKKKCINIFFSRVSQDWNVRKKICIQQSKPSSKLFFYRYSEFWFSSDIIQNKKYVKQLNTSCLICLTNNCQIIMKQCGHYCLCQLCFKSYIEKQNNRCVICKNKIKTAYKIVARHQVHEVVDIYTVKSK